MHTYLVGGAVRDQLLAAGGTRTPAGGDRDWVVVGATPEDMVKAGYTPVGRDFPVFLHPKTHEEYALARTERKRAPGYHGFVFHAGLDVTLEDDLVRRDLTINAMAMDDRGRLIDLHGGARDLRERLLRHVSPAFAEDPVRILRVARFAARWPEFSLADETLALCQAMVLAGEVDALVAERVWQELARGLMEARPSRMFELLRACGALERLLPEVDQLFAADQDTVAGALDDLCQPAALADATLPTLPTRSTGSTEPGQLQGGAAPQHHDAGEHLLRMLDLAARLDAPLSVRYACLGHAIGSVAIAEQVTGQAAGQAADEAAGHSAGQAAGHAGGADRSPGPAGLAGAELLRGISQRLRVPTALRELAELTAREHAVVHASASHDAATVLRLLQRCDAWRRPERFAELLVVCECAARAQHGQSEQVYLPRQRLGEALQAAQAVDASAVVARARHLGQTGPALARALDQARELALGRTTGALQPAHQQVHQ